MTALLLLQAALAAAPPLLGPNGVEWLGPLPPGSDVSVTVDPDSARLYVDEWDEEGIRTWDGQRWTRAGEPVTARLEDPNLRFSSSGRLRSATDAAGVTRSYGYTAEGRLDQIRWPDGRSVDIRYDDRGRVDEIRGPGGARERYRWSDGLTVDRTPGGRLIRRPINPGGSAQRAFSVRDGAGREVRSFYAEGRLVAWEDPRGLRTVLEREEDRLRVLLPTGTSWVLRFGEEQRLTKLVGPRGGEWRWTWGEHGPASLRDPTGRMFRTEFDEGGQIAARVLGGRRVTVTRDGAGRVTALRSPSGAETILERDPGGLTRALIDAAGNRIELERVGGRITAIVGRDGARWEIDRDGAGRPRAVSLPTGARFDLRRGATGRIVAIDDSRFGVTRLFHDIEGRVTRVTAPDGRQTGLVRDGHGAVVAVRRADASTVRIERDPSGEIRWVAVGEDGVDVERDPRGLPIRVGPVRWARDLRGDVVGLRTRALDLTLERDLAGRLWGVTADPWVLGIQHDASGLPIAWRGTDGDLLVQRDANGLVVAEDHPDGGLLALRGPRGHLQRVTVGDQQWRLNRNADGRVLRAVGPGGLKGGVDRDAAGRVKLVRYPSGVLKKLSYEDTLLHTRVEAASGAPLLQRTASVGPGGVLAWVQEGDGARAVWHTDPIGNLAAIEAGPGAWSWGVDLAQGPDDQVLVFDEDGRLEEARIAPGIPAWGVATEILTVYQDASGRMGGFSGEMGVAEVRFDPVGRLAEVRAGGQSWRLTWDPVGRLASVTDPTGASRAIRWLPEQQGRSADLLRIGEDQPWLPGLGEPVAVGTAGGEESIVEVGGDPRFVIDRDGRALEVTTTPSGRADSGAARAAGAGGGVQLFAGGPVVHGAQALDPVSGQHVGERLRWPWEVRQPREIDGVRHLDPSVWAPRGPWHQPLQLLVALGEVDLPEAGGGVTLLEPPPAVPWLPMGLDRVPSPLGGSPWVLDIDEDPLVERLVEGILPGAPPLEPTWLLPVLLSDLSALWEELPPGLSVPGLEVFDPSQNTE